MGGLRWTGRKTAAESRRRNRSVVLGGAGGGLRGMLRAEIMDTARDQFLVDVWITFMTRECPI